MQFTSDCGVRAASSAPPSKPLRASTSGGLLSVTAVYRAPSLGAASALPQRPEHSHAGPPALPTRRSYRAAWADWEERCVEHKRPALPGSPLGIAAKHAEWGYTSYVP